MWWWPAPPATTTPRGGLERGYAQELFLDAIGVVGVVPVGGAGRLQRRFHSRRSGGGMGGLIKGGSSGDVWAGHGGAGDGVVAVAFPGGEDADAGGDQVD